MRGPDPSIGGVMVPRAPMATLTSIGSPLTGVSQRETLVFASAVETNDRILVTCRWQTTFGPCFQRGGLSADARDSEIRQGGPS
jgi:hypothetical protein